MSTLFDAEPIPQAIVKTATLSPCGRYRYHLGRTWGKSFRALRCGVIMLNPSTADADVDDPTIRRLYHFIRSRRWGDFDEDLMFGGFDVFNLFAYRATNPATLARVADPVGPDNDRTLAESFPYSFEGYHVICAWGNESTPLIRERAKAVRQWLDTKHHHSGGGMATFCLGLTQNGSPRHPLYLPNLTEWEEYNPCRYE